MAEKTFDLSVIFKMIDRFSNPLKQSMLTFNKWIKKTKEANSVTKEFGRNIKSVGDSMQSVGQRLSVGLTLPIAALATSAVKASLDFETAFTGVRKTVNATEKEFQVLNEQFKDMALKVPIATTELFGIGEAAGQLGIETKNIIGFTKTMAALGVATNMSANQAATSLARLANITQMPQDQFDRLGSTVVHLGNNLATTEAEIVDMGLRLAGVGNQIGLSEDQILSFAGALSSLGIRAEAGGTAFSQVMVRISKEIGSGSKKMQGFAAISDKSVSDFETLWKKDATKALIPFIEGLGKLSKRGINVSQVLDALGMEGIRISDTLLRASGAGEKMRDALEMGSKAWAENLALTKEANLRYSTGASRLRLFWNQVRQTAASFGDVLIPMLLKFLNVIEPVFKWLKDLSPTTKKWISVILLLAASIGPIVVGLGLLTAALGAIMASGASIAVIAGITAAIVALEVAFVAVIAYFDEIVSFFKSIPDVIGNAAHNIKNKLIDILPGFIANMIGGGGPVFGATPNMPTPVIPGASNSQTDVNIKVSADQGSSAQIDNVKKKGDANVSLISESYLGMNLAGGT